MPWDGIAGCIQVEADLKDAFGLPMNICVKSEHAINTDKYQLGIWANETQVALAPSTERNHSKSALCGLLDDFHHSYQEDQRWRAEVLYGGALVPWGGWPKQ